MLSPWTLSREKDDVTTEVPGHTGGSEKENSDRDGGDEYAEPEDTV